MVNNDLEDLNFQIDLHGNLDLSEADELFTKHYNNIIKGLENESIDPNKEDDHVIKVICGYGRHHSEKPMMDSDSKEAKILKEHFL